jgi:siroheme synthase (precorrin-2 oxidase/ferrochelatase)
MLDLPFTSTVHAVRKTIALKTITKTLLTTALVTAVGTGTYEARVASHLQDQITALLLQQDSLTERNQQLQQELDQAANRLVETQPDTGRSRQDLADLLMLRAAVAKLRGDSQELAQLKAAAAWKANDPTESEMKSWLSRVGSSATAP